MILLLYYTIIILIISNGINIIKNKNYIIGNINPCYPDKDYILPDTGSILKLLGAGWDKIKKYWKVVINDFINKRKIQ